MRTSSAHLACALYLGWMAIAEAGGADPLPAASDAAGIEQGFSSSRDVQELKSEAARARAEARKARAIAEAAKAEAEAAARAANPATGATGAAPTGAKSPVRRPASRTSRSSKQLAGTTRPEGSGRSVSPPPASVQQRDAVSDEAARLADPQALDAARAKRPAVGSVINGSSWTEHADFVGPGLAWAVAHGVQFEVGPHQPVQSPPAFLAATRKYAGSVKLSADGTRLIDHVAGLPFPQVAAEDPQAGARHMFNFDSAIAHDDAAIRYLECNTGTLGKGSAPAKVERTFLVGQFMRLYYSERLTVSPTPELPNPDGIRYREALYPLIEPFDLAGVSFTANRYLDPDRQDDGWLYIP